MSRSTWIARRIGIGVIAVILALGGLLSQPAGTLAAVSGKMHLEDISVGIISNKSLPKSPNP